MVNMVDIKVTVRDTCGACQMPIDFPTEPVVIERVHYPRIGAMSTAYHWKCRPSLDADNALIEFLEQQDKNKIGEPRPEEVVARATVRYNALVEFLEQQDKNKIGDEPPDPEVYEKAVEKYELLHEILKIQSPPRWCT